MRPRRSRTASVVAVIRPGPGDQVGQALIYVLAAGALILGAAFAGFVLARNELSLARSQGAAVQARQLAEAGVAAAEDQAAGGGCSSQICSGHGGLAAGGYVYQATCENWVEATEKTAAHCAQKGLWTVTATGTLSSGAGKRSIAATVTFDSHENPRVQSWSEN